MPSMAFGEWPVHFIIARPVHLIIIASQVQVDVAGRDRLRKLRADEGESLLSGRCVLPLKCVLAMSEEGTPSNVYLEAKARIWS